MNEAPRLLTRSHDLSVRPGRGFSRGKVVHLRPLNLQYAKRQKPSDLFSTKGAQYDSPGQRPGFAESENLRALKGRYKRRFALTGLDGFLAFKPRTLSWAISLRPVGAMFGRIGVFLRLDPAKVGNFLGLGYGH